MLSAASPQRVRVVEGVISPATGVLGLLAAPVPWNDRLAEALRAIGPAGLPALLERIAFHRIDGLAHRAVGRLPQAAVDPWLRSALRRRAQRFAAATISQGLALAEVLEALDRCSIPVVVMRGLASIESIYGDPSLRPFEDHDLLVLPEDGKAAGAALLRLGFEEETPTLLRRGGVIVDLHTDPLGARRRPTRQEAFPVSVRGLIERATPGRVAGAPALVLEPEDDLLLLAIHLVKHSFDRLVRIADLSHFVFHKRGLLDWSVLGRRAESCRAAKFLTWALEAAGILGVGVRAIDLPAHGAGCALERYLMGRALALRPLPYSGEILSILAAGTPGMRARLLIDALWPESERPREPWERASALPRRVFELARGGAHQVAARRRIR